MQKNKICAILMTIFLSLPIYAEETETIVPQEILTQEETVQQEVVEPSLDFMQERFKKPVSKKKIAKKFLLAMLGVGLSSVFIYLSLSVYNKIRDGVLTSNGNIEPQEGDKSLDTPENLSEAVKTFVEKTKWN